jgi:hypothetical protein
MTAPFSFLGNSNVLIDVLTDEGVATGLQLKGNCPSLSIKGDSERIEQLGTGRDNFGQVIASATFAKPATLSFTLDQVDQDMFAMAFFGTNSTFTQTSGTVTDDPVVTIHDKWVEVGAYNISAVSVENTAGTVTYVVGTDYEINPRLGAIKALSTGAITAGQTVHVTYTKAAISSIQMAAMTKTNIRVRLVLDGQNFADGRNFILDIYQARLAPSGDFGFQAGSDKKFMEATFEATMETPSGGTEPFKLTWLS